ncbi:L,D-transpeptidase [Catelliglobosispora koreensis]|uniref:L,D-transpeptidase n=1 Tax=Catelliglobosispora koreensis TaxID=129052 RepID=UPI0003724868|nr:Ig-like domain-containing protein [Catelliglobosispora koreensis]
MPTRRHTLTALGLAGASVAGLAACSDKPSFSDSAKEQEQKSAKAKASITSPAEGAADVPAGHEFTFTSTDAVDTKFELLDANGAAVAGEMHPDGKGWLPAKMLTWGASYTAKVSATGDDSKTFTAETKFTVMAKPSNEVRVISFLPDNREIGTGMPLIFQLSRDIPKDQRAALQRRMLVKTEPATEGVWGWYTSREVHWRPKEFWKPGTKIFVDSHVGGMPLGEGFYARANVTFTGTTGRQLIMTIDDAKAPKEMVVTIDGVEAKRIKVSLGKPTWQSSSGIMIIMEKLEHTVFDTTNDPNARERYRADIDWAQRITHSGEHLHSAPWSVQHQGIRNVSHGCVNMSPDDAKWLFDITKQGDPVITSNTGQVLKWGDGWTHWTESFEDYAKRSAIPLS